MTPASRASVSLPRAVRSSIRPRALLVDALRVFQDRVDRLPGPVFVTAEEARVAAGVAGDPRCACACVGLLDLEQYSVVVAVEAMFLDARDVAALFALPAATL